MKEVALQVREVYERAIANVPPAAEKRYWQRYIFLWINYALWEELEAEDPERTREVYKACLDLMPHKVFTFAKVCTSLSFTCLPSVMECDAACSSRRHAVTSCLRVLDTIQDKTCRP